METRDRTHCHGVCQSRSAHTNCRNRCDNFSQLQLVENGGFPSSIKTNHKDSHFFLAKETLEQTTDHTTHVSKLIAPRTRL